MMELFLTGDQERAQKEIDCYGYCLKNAIASYLNSEFGKTAAYLYNAARSARELEHLRERKRMESDAWLLLKQLESERQQEELLARLGR